MRGKRIIGAVAATAAGVLLIAAPATAHVVVSPSTAAKGSEGILTFRMPSEQDTANAVRLELDIPSDHPIASVSVEPQNGWTYVVDNTTLATAIKTDDGSVTQIVSKVTWTATNGGLKPGEFSEFHILAGPLPTDTNMVEFKALQTYSNGDIVRWIDDPAPAGGTEPDHPAPLLTLTAATGDAMSATPAATSTTDFAKKSTASAALAVGIIAIVVGALGLIAGVVAVTRKRS